MAEQYGNVKQRKGLKQFLLKKCADTWPLNLPAVGDKVRSAILNVVIYSSPRQHSDSPGNPGKVEQFKTRAMGGKKQTSGKVITLFSLFFSSAL